MKGVIKSVAAVTLSGCLSLGIGCSKSNQEFEAPDIKMITPENVHGVIAPDDNHIWLTGNYGTIFYSPDGGVSWARQESGVKESIIIDGSFINSTTGWLAGLNGTVLYTTNSGEIWTRQNTETDKHLLGICFVDKKHGWAIGEWNTVLRTLDGGTTWQRMTEETDKILNNIVFINPTTGWLVGERGLIRHTSDGGITWQDQKPKKFERASFEEELRNPAPSLFCITFTDKNTGWVCGIDGTIGRTTNGGKTWSILDSPTDQTLYTVFVRDAQGWIVGDKGAYLVSVDGGQTWDLKEDVIKTRLKLRDVFFSSPRKGWVVGASGTVVNTTDGGGTWEFCSGFSYAMDFFQMPKVLEFGGGVE
ncbi:MAG: hypothetical protein GY868_20515 [Deltaproteobacteria bacterium]|nr:hypothetical protein [Deltaproteobacteria bacterium]